MNYTVEYSDYGRVRYWTASAIELPAVLAGLTHAGHKILRVRAQASGAPTHDQARLF